MIVGLGGGQDALVGDPDLVISAILWIAAIIFVAASILIRRSTRSRTTSDVWSGPDPALGFVLVLDAVIILGVAIALLVL